MSVILCIAGAFALAFSGVAVYIVRKLRKHDLYLRSMLFQQSFTNDAIEMMLWKIRYNIVRWEKEFVESENYEMAQEAKKASTIIEGMINYYRENMKGD
jgi:hypothetical protein